VNNGNYVNIHSPKIEKDNLITCQVTFSKNLRRFFSLDEFYIKYDTSIIDVPSDILSIPSLGSVITTAWAVGADVYIDSIDADYLHSLNKIKTEFSKIYPGIDFKGEILAEQVVQNKSSNDRLGMLFSGGLDSTSLYLQNRNEKPDLFTFIGGIIPTNSRRFIRKMKNVYGRFAEREQVKLFFIESNVRDFLNESLLSVMFAKKIFFLPWWETITHGIIQSSMCAPITVCRNYSLKIALSFFLNYGAEPNIVGNLRWAGIDVVPSGYEYDRHEKIHFVYKDFVENHFHPKLQVCLYAPSTSDHLNCGYCQKCARTIIELLAEGIDPRKCGFRIHDDFFEHTRKRIIPQSKAFKWEGLQKQILEGTDYSTLSNGDFFDWFKNYEFGEESKEPNTNSIVNDLFSQIHTRLPRRGKNIIRKFFISARKKENSRSRVLHKVLEILEPLLHLKKMIH
jgi:hypothetical protein